MPSTFIKFRINKGEKLPKNAVGSEIKSLSSSGQQIKSTETPSPSQLKVRAKDGCFCCRKRRIKCDKMRPTCLKCTKSGYVCVWPQGNKSLSHNTDFQLIRVGTIDKYADSKQSNLKTSVFPVGSENCKNVSIYSLTDGEYDDPEENTKEELKDVVQIPIKMASIETKKFTKKVDKMHDALFRKLLLEINTSATGSLAFPLSLFPNYTERDRLLFDAFTSGFIVDISPQLTHVKLQPGSVFIPTGFENSIVQSMLFSCGAAFLKSKGTVDTAITTVFNERLNHSAVHLSNFLAKNTVEGNERWIMVYLLLLYLRSRFSFVSHQRNTLEMIAITEVVKVWVSKATNCSNSSSHILPSKTAPSIRGVSNDLNNSQFSLLDTSNPILDISANCLKTVEDPDLMLIRVINDSRHLLRERGGLPVSKDYNSFYLELESFEVDILAAIFNSNNQETNTPGQNMFPQERTLLESFAYNYSVMIFMCDRSLTSQITSPFVIFDLLRPYLNLPIYQCAVPWMNHPVVGAALPLCELQAKVSWISLFTPLSAHHKSIISRIIKVAKYYTKPMLPLDVYCREPEPVQKKLMESCYAAEIFAKAVYIYATKLLYPETTTTDKNIQEALQKMCLLFQNISAQSQVHIILCFPLTVMASCAVTKEHQEFLRWKLAKLRNAFSLQSFQSLETFCNVIWKEFEVLGSDRGLLALFNYDYLKLLNH